MFASFHWRVTVPPEVSVAGVAVSPVTWRKGYAASVDVASRVAVLLL